MLIHFRARVVSTNSQRWFSGIDVKIDSFFVKREIRFPNSGTASMALSKYVLGMVYCGAGE